MNSKPHGILTSPLGWTLQTTGICALNFMSLLRILCATACHFLSALPAGKSSQKNALGRNNRLAFFLHRFEASSNSCCGINVFCFRTASGRLGTARSILASQPTVCGCCEMIFPQPEVFDTPRQYGSGTKAGKAAMVSGWEVLLCKMCF